MLESSTVITTSLPTSSIILEMISPNSLSLEEMVAIFAISSALLIGFAVDLMYSTTFSTAFSIPFLMKIGFAPAITFRNPSFTNACANTIAVVVPSPDTVLVFADASYTSLLPIFSNSSGNTISFAMVTPSFVMSGAV